METVFTAIADPTRRQVLERLRLEGPLSVTQLAEPMQVTRQAVTKHLDILHNAGLIHIERHGRERRHRLQPQPLKQLDDWLKPYAEFWDQAFDRLRQHLDEPDSDNPANQNNKENTP